MSLQVGKKYSLKNSRYKDQELFFKGHTDDTLINGLFDVYKDGVVTMADRIICIGGNPDVDFIRIPDPLVEGKHYRVVSDQHDYLSLAGKVMQFEGIQPFLDTKWVKLSPLDKCMALGFYYRDVKKIVLELEDVAEPAKDESIYIIWGPSGKTNPRVTFVGQAAADEVAESMTKYHKQQFYAAKLVTKFMPEIIVNAIKEEMP